jgi:hypothetical protein
MAMRYAMIGRRDGSTRRCPDCFKNVTYHRRSVFGPVRAYNVDETDHKCDMPDSLEGKVKRIFFGE